MSFTQENSTQKCLVAVKEGRCEVPAEPDTISAQHPTWQSQKWYCPFFLKNWTQARTLGIMGHQPIIETFQRMKRSDFVVITMRDKEDTASRHWSFLKEGAPNISDINENQKESLCKFSSGILVSKFIFSTNKQSRSLRHPFREKQLGT